jgi:hypothetical protein
LIPAAHAFQFIDFQITHFHHSSILRLAAHFPSPDEAQRNPGQLFVGWVERNPPYVFKVMGFAPLNPSYELNPVCDAHHRFCFCTHFVTSARTSSVCLLLRSAQPGFSTSCIGCASLRAGHFVELFSLTGEYRSRIAR